MFYTYPGNHSQRGDPSTLPSGLMVQVTSTCQTGGMLFYKSLPRIPRNGFQRQTLATLEAPFQMPMDLVFWISYTPYAH